MRHIQNGPIAFHHCYSCHGMFFTQDAYMTSLRSGKIRLKYPEQPEVDQAAAATVRDRACPACAGQVMLAKNVGAIEIDACRKCRGV